MKGFKWLGYLLLGVVCFFFFLYQTFPYDQLKGRIMTMADQQLGGAYQLAIDAFDTSWLTGFTLEGVRLMSRGESRQKVLVAVKEVGVRVGVLATLFGSPAVSYDLDFTDGEIEGTFERSEDLNQLHATIDELSLARLPILEDLTGLKFQGTLSGDIDMQINTRQLKQSEGSVGLVMDQWKILKGSKIKLGAMGDIDLDQGFVLTKGNGSKIDIELSKGTVRIAAFTLKGGDIELDVQGQVFLEQKLSNSRLNLKGSVKFSDTMKDIVPVQMLGAANPDDESYPLELSGRVSNLRKKIGNFAF